MILIGVPIVVVSGVELFVVVDLEQTHVLPLIVLFPYKCIEPAMQRVVVAEVGVGEGKVDGHHLHKFCHPRNVLLDGDMLPHR